MAGLAGGSNSNLNLLKAHKMWQVFQGTPVLLQAQLQHFLKVPVQLVQRRTLGMGAWHARDRSHIEAALRIPFDVGGESFHASLLYGCYIRDYRRAAGFLLT